MTAVHEHQHTHDARRVQRDPTNTRGIRRELRASLDRRWRGVKGLLRDAWRQDVFGFERLNAQSLQNTITGGGQIQAFQSFFDAALQRVVIGDRQWLAPHISKGYEAGVSAAHARLPTTNAPAAILRDEMLATAAFVELQGVVEAVSQQAVRTVSNGSIERVRAMPLLRAINKRIDAIGQVRGHALADYWVVKAHATGTLDTLEIAGVSRVATIPEHVRTLKKRQVGDAKLPSIRTLLRRENKLERTLGGGKVNVLTAFDNDVCPVCEEISENGPYTINTARGLIPAHPHCRCAFVPA